MLCCKCSIEEATHVYFCGHTVCHKCHEERNNKQLCNICGLLIHDPLSFKVDWVSLYKSTVIREDFIDKYKKYIHWKELCQHQKLSEEILRKYIDFLPMEEVSKYQCLSSKFIEDYSDKVLWPYILLYQEEIPQTSFNKHYQK